MFRLLLVEDQKEFQMIIAKIFEDGQHSLTVAGDARQARGILENEKFDLVLMDISLPDEGGLELCAKLRESEATAHLPVIFITGSESLPSKLTAFSLGAEDYIVKPFNYHELKARVTAKLRKVSRTMQSAEESRLGPFLFKLAAQKVYNTSDGQEFGLSPREMKLLYYLARNDDRVMSRQQILDEVWGGGVNVTDRTVDTHIYLLRKKLGSLSVCIEAVPGIGYRFTSSAAAKTKAA